MSGWDTPSRPTWDPQDGPEDGTQAFSTPDAPVGDDDPWGAPAGSGWGASSQSGGTDFGRSGQSGGADFGRSGYGGSDSGAPGFGRGVGGTGGTGGSDSGLSSAGDAFGGPPPEFFTEEFEQRTPGASLRRSAEMPSWDLPVRGGNERDRNGAGPNGAGPNGAGPNGAGANGAGAQPPAWEQTPSWDEPQWQDAHRQDFGRQDDYGRPDPGRQDFGGQDFGGQSFGRQDELSRPDLTRQDFDRPDFGRQDEHSRPDLTRQDLDRPDFGRQDPGRQDPGRQGFDGPGFDGPGFGSQDPAVQEFPRRQPGLAYSEAQRGYPAQPGSPQPGYPAQPDQSDQPLSPAARLEQDRAARMDPALHDFFAPTASGPGHAPRPGQVRRELEAPRGSQGPQAPGRPVDPWDDPVGYQAPGPQRGPDGPGARGGSGTRGGSGARDGFDSRESSGGRASRILAVGAVVVVVVAVGAYLLLHKPHGSNTANGATPTVTATSSTVPTSTTTAKAKPKAKASVNSPASGGGTTDGYVLSTPSVAGGYPLGTDPHFLATTTATAAAIEQSAVSGHGGTVTGKPVSASYTLPAEQTIEFVGYQGAFNPKTVMTNLKAFGTTEATYSAGPHGGEMACANVPATATAGSGGVCVWVTATTLGVTEFFTQTGGPEVLTEAQPKGAADTIALRSSVETRKS